MEARIIKLMNENSSYILLLAFLRSGKLSQQQQIKNLEMWLRERVAVPISVWSKCKLEL